MFEKCFKVVSNSRQHLTAELISEALLNYFTLDPTKPDVAFGVIEESGQKKKNNKKNQVTIEA